MFHKSEQDNLCVDASKYDRLEWHAFLNEFQDCVQDAYDASSESVKNGHYEMNVLSREIFSRVFSSAEKKVKKSDMRHVNDIHSALSVLPEFREAKMGTKGDYLYSGAFTLGFMSTLSQSINWEETDELVDEDGDIVIYQKSKYNGMSEMRMRNALRNAVKDGNEMVDIFQEMEGIGGMGNDGEGPCAGNTEGEPSRRENVKKLVSSKHKDKLRRISAAVGRMKHVMNAAVTKRAVYAKSELYGVKLGNDFGNLLSSEITKLAMGGAMQAETLGRIASGNALNLAFRGKQKEGMGPILVYVDGSGSMGCGFRGATAGDWAVAIGVTLCMAANKKKRGFMMVPFGYRLYTEYKLEKGFTTSQLLKTMEFNPSGGTQFTPCFGDAFLRLNDSEFKKADIIMVTDGDASDNCHEYVKQCKAKGARIHLIKIGNFAYRTAIDGYADTVTQCVDGDNDNDLDEMFSSVLKEN